MTVSRLREARAHGKVILFGEHAVVYGIPALAVGIDRGVRAKVEHLGEGHPCMLRLGSWNLTVSEQEGGEDVPVGRAFRDLLRVTRDAQRDAGTPAASALLVDATSELPAGGGLGFSAALGVAVARALDPLASDDTIAERVMTWERVFHGNPSGIDAAVSARGGCVMYERRSNVPASIQSVRVPRPLLLCVGNSGSPSSTKTMVENVARLRERRPETTQKAFDAIQTLVKNARLALEDGDERAVGQLLDLNQMLLSGLFLSTPEIEQMCAAARAAGAHGAKLTGAGGGGCVVALVEGHATADAVLAAWKRDGFEGFSARFGGGAGRDAFTLPLVQEAV